MIPQDKIKHIVERNKVIGRELSTLELESLALDEFLDEVEVTSSEVTLRMGLKPEVFVGYMLTYALSNGDQIDPVEIPRLVDIACGRPVDLEKEPLKTIEGRQVPPSIAYRCLGEIMRLIFAAAESPSKRILSKDKAQKVIRERVIAVLPRPSEQHKPGQTVSFNAIPRAVNG